jgi:S-(hydroxymethyl)glutathione dehydrogenase/alcohol dehydrogenase
MSAAGTDIRAAGRFEGRTMRAAVFRQAGAPPEIEELEIAEPGEHEVLVALGASGVCHSDAHVVDGEWSAPTPLVLGHEGAGVVAALGERVERLSVGDHVILSWCPGCGRCEWCISGRPQLCEVAARTAYESIMPDRTTRLRQGDQPVYAYLGTGTLAEYAVVPQTAAIPIPSQVPLDQAALVGCAVATGVGAVMNTARVPVGASVGIIGLGGVGAAAVQGAKAAGAATIVAVDVRADKLALAGSLGATHCVDASREDPVVAVRTLSGGRGLDFVFEAIGLPQTIEQGARLLAPAGTLVLVGMTPTGAVVRLDPLRIADRELRVIGCNYGSCRPSLDFPRILQLSERGLLDLERLITRRLPLSRTAEAFAAMARGEGLRSVIVPRAEERA